MYEAKFESVGDMNAAAHEVSRFLSKQRGQGNNILIEVWQDQLRIRINPTYSKHGHGGVLLDIIRKGKADSERPE